MLAITYLFIILQTLCLGDRVCEELPALENGIIQCDEGPLYAGKACYFQCNNGYELQGERVKRCLFQSYQWSGPSPKCVPIARDPPQNPRVTCQEGNGGCQDYCTHRRGFVECYCSRGYKLDADGKKCNDIDECSSEFLNNCQHICSNTDGSFTCSCNPGYVLDEGHKCEGNYGKPVHSVNPYPRNPCHTDNGGCDQLCSLSRDWKVFCSCRKGFRPDSTDPKKCIRDPPENPPVPPSRATCDVENGGCEHHCSYRRGFVHCSCSDGYQLHSDGKNCIENPPAPPPRATCQEGNGGCQDYCSDRRGFVECYCSRGYKLDADGKKCNDIDECSSEFLNNCQHICSNTDGSFTCSCKPGYVLVEGHKCEDIDECSSEFLNNCQHICSNTDGSFTCSCKPGYVLVDGHKCEGCGKGSYWSVDGCVECPAFSGTNSDL